MSKKLNQCLVKKIPIELRISAFKYFIARFTVGKAQCCIPWMFMPDPGSWILDPNFSIPDSGSKRARIQIHIKEFKYFYKKNVSKLSENNLGCSSWILDPGVKKVNGSGSAALVAPSSGDSPFYF
jgi:hypothetical protein